MKKLLLSIILAALAIVPSDLTSGPVKGYYRKDGTYVAPHNRRESSNPKAAKKTQSPPVTKPTKYTGKSYEVYQQRKRQGSRNFSPSTHEKKYKECGGVCAHCGKHCTLSEMDADHIVPYSKGGKTEESNCQMLCRHCNRSKGNRSCK